MRYKINQHIRYQYLLTVILFLFFAKNVISQIRVLGNGAIICLTHTPNVSATMAIWYM